MFYDFTSIHPFANPNGRIGTCLINIFLRSINQPSILLRFPEERNDPASSYCQAIKTINESRDNLANHIYKRIVAAEITTYENELRMQNTASMFELVSLLQTFQ